MHNYIQNVEITYWAKRKTKSAAERALVVGVAAVDVFASFKYLVTGAVPAIGRAAFVGQVRTSEPNAELPNATGSVGTEIIIGKGHFGFGKSADGISFGGTVVFGVNGEATTSYQVIADRNTARAFQAVPYGNGTVGCRGHLIG